MDKVLGAPGTDIELKEITIFSALAGKLKVPINLDPFNGPETIVARIGPGSSVLTEVSMTANNTSPILIITDSAVGEVALTIPPGIFSLPSAPIAFLSTVAVPAT